MKGWINRFRLLENYKNSKFDKIFTTCSKILYSINNKHWYASISSSIDSDRSLTVFIIDKIQNFTISDKYFNLFYHFKKRPLILKNKN